MNADDQILEQRLRDAMPLLINEARRYANSPGEEPDLIQEGRIAIAYAHAKFKATNGAKFFSYARKGVRWRMDHWMRTRGRLLRVGPVSYRKWGPATLCCIDLPVGHDKKGIPIDAEEEIEPMASTPAAVLQEAEKQAALATALESLPDCLKIPVVKHYFRGRTLLQTARECGLTTHKAIQLRLDKAFRMMRRKMELAA